MRSSGRAENWKGWAAANVFVGFVIFYCKPFHPSTFAMNADEDNVGIVTPILYVRRNCAKFASPQLTTI